MLATHWDVGPNGARILIRGRSRNIQIASKPGLWGYVRRAPRFSLQLRLRVPPAPPVVKN